MFGGANSAGQRGHGRWRRNDGYAPTDPRDRRNTKSVSSWAHSAPSVLAEAQRAESGQRGCSGGEAHVLVMEAAEVGQGNHLTCVRQLDSAAVGRIFLQ